MPSMKKIHETALIDRRAELASDVEVGSYSIIGPQVKIGQGTRIKSHVVLEGRTTLGQGNVIFPFAAVGTMPQDLKYKGEASELSIGNYNTIREYASLNPGTQGGGMITRIGDGNLLMMYCHIAHDCALGNRNIIANGATLGGHVVVEDFVIVGGLVGIHQFVRVGSVQGRAAVLQRHRGSGPLARDERRGDAAPRLRQAEDRHSEKSVPGDFSVQA